MRLHHYAFSHRVLPAQLQSGDGILGVLANPGNQDYLVKTWDAVPRSKHFLELSAHYQDQLQALIPGQIVSQELNAGLAIDTDSVPSQGLAYNSFWLGGQHLVFLVQMPQALAS